MDSEKSLGQDSSAPVSRILPLCDPDRLETAFQPIFRASTGELEGCEALMRLPAESGFAGPFEAFSVALAEGRAVELERASLRRALADAEPFAGRLRLYLNVLAPVFDDPETGADWLVERVTAAGRAPGQVILEIPELVRIHDFAALGRSLAPFRKAGFRVAIDDFGAGYTNLRMIVDLAPDYVKLDRVFIDGISSNATKRILVESVVSLCHRINCRVIAEGIETSEDLETCLSAGVDQIQGFLLSRPAPAEEAFLVDDLALPVAEFRPDRNEVAGLTETGPTVESSDRMALACERFRSDPDLDVLPVLLRGRVVALLARDEANAWRRSVTGDPEEAGRRTVGTVLEDPVFDQIPDTASLGDVAELVKRRPRAFKLDPIVVNRADELFRGLLRVDTVIGELARLKVEFEHQLNPLTRLPGRPRMEEMLSRGLQETRLFAFARVNVQRFHFFNDRYGVTRGDRLLLALASILRDELAGEAGSFLAHESADDFSFIVAAERIERTATRVCDRFAVRAPELYDPTDLADGGFHAPGPGGEVVWVEPVTLVIGAAVWTGEAGVSVGSLVEDAELALKDARRGIDAAPFAVRKSRSEAARGPITQLSLRRPKHMV